MTEKDLLIQDLRRENAELRARVPQWVSVEDRLPEPFTPALVYRKSFGTPPSYISIDKMVLWNDDTQVWADEIKTWKAVTTHWMPLPSTEGLE